MGRDAENEYEDECLLIFFIFFYGKDDGFLPIRSNENENKGMGWQ